MDHHPNAYFFCTNRFWLLYIFKNIIKYMHDGDKYFCYWRQLLMNKLFLFLLVSTFNYIKSFYSTKYRPQLYKNQTITKQGVSDFFLLAVSSFLTYQYTPGTAAVSSLQWIWHPQGSRNITNKYAIHAYTHGPVTGSGLVLGWFLFFKWCI